jgi:hypothetical protein
MILTEVKMLGTIKETLLEATRTPEISNKQISKLILVKTKKQLKRLNSSKPTPL